MVDRGPSSEHEAPGTADRLLIDRGPSYRGSPPSRDTGDLMDYRGPSTTSTAPNTGDNPCAHPVTIDAQGIRHFKRECF